MLSATSMSSFMLFVFTVGIVTMVFPSEFVISTLFCPTCLVCRFDVSSLYLLSSRPCDCACGEFFAKNSPHAQSQGLLDSKYKDETSNLQTKQVGQNKVEITNSLGKTIVTMPTVKTNNMNELIEVADSINDGLFWEPALVNNRLGVRINRSHTYYERVYVPSFNDAVTVQGIDSILWALAKCEQEVMDSEVRKRLT